jgi:molecular chaperone DnaK (HSP70)
MGCKILVAALTLALSTASQAAQIYKWVDAQGVTHFDAQPPAGQQVQQIDVQKPPQPPPPAAKPAVDPAASQKAIDDKVRKQVAAQEAKRKEICETLRNNLAQLQINSRVRLQVGSEVRRMTEEERQQQLTQTQKSLDESCKD